MILLWANLSLSSKPYQTSPSYQSAGCFSLPGHETEASCRPLWSERSPGLYVRLPEGEK